MVEYKLNLDSVFSSLADPTRRDILHRVSASELSVGDIAKAYNLTLAAVSKHLKVLEKARLVTKKRRGKAQMVQMAPQTLRAVDEYLAMYREQWEQRLDLLETYLNEEGKTNDTK